MAIQVAQITGDTVELVFNPAEDSLSVGENLSVIGGHEERGLIVQVVELKAIFGGALLPGRHQYPSAVRYLDRLVVARRLCPRVKSPVCIWRSARFVR